MELRRINWKSTKRNNYNWLCWRHAVRAIKKVKLYSSVKSTAETGSFRINIIRDMMIAISDEFHYSRIMTKHTVKGHLFSVQKQNCLLCEHKASYCNERKGVMRWLAWVILHYESFKTEWRILPSFTRQHLLLSQVANVTNCALKILKNSQRKRHYGPAETEKKNKIFPATYTSSIKF